MEYLYINKTTGKVKYLKPSKEILNHIPIINIEVQENFEIGPEENYIFELNKPLTKTEQNKKGLIKTLEDGTFIPYILKESILKKLKDTDTEFTRPIEDVIIYMIEDGKEFDQSILDHIEKKQSLRLQLKNLEE